MIEFEVRGISVLPYARDDMKKRYLPSGDSDADHSRPSGWLITGPMIDRLGPGVVIGAEDHVVVDATNCVLATDIRHDGEALVRRNEDVEPVRAAVDLGAEHLGLGVGAVDETRPPGGRDPVFALAGEVQGAVDGDRRKVLGRVGVDRRAEVVRLTQTSPSRSMTQMS